MKNLTLIAGILLSSTAYASEWETFDVSDQVIVSENKEGNSKLIVALDSEVVTISYKILDGSLGACNKEYDTADVELLIDSSKLAPYVDSYTVPTTSDNYVVELYKDDWANFYNDGFAQMLALSDSITVSTCNGWATSTFTTVEWPAIEFGMKMSDSK